MPIRSSNKYLKLSDTLAPDPKCPFAVANIAAVVMLRICVIKDKTVLFICTVALIPSSDFIRGIFKTVSINTVVSLRDLAISGKANMSEPSLFLNNLSKSMLYGLLNLIGSKVLAADIPFLIKNCLNSALFLNKNLPIPKSAISL